MDYTKVFDCVDHSKLWKILKEMGIPDHLTCLLRNLYAGQEASLSAENEEAGKVGLQRDVEDEKSCLAGKARHQSPNSKSTIREL